MSLVDSGTFAPAVPSREADENGMLRNDRNEFFMVLWSHSHRRERPTELGTMIDDNEFRQLAERAREMLCVVDEDGRFAYANPAWTRVLGWLPSELVSSSYLDLVHPDDLENTSAMAAALASGSEVAGYVNRYRTKEGYYRDVQWWSQPGEGEFIYATAYDITENHRSSSRAAEIEDVSGVCSWELDVERGDVYWSPATKRLIGWFEDRQPTLEEVYSFVPEHAQAALLPCVDTLLATGTPYALEIPWLRCGGGQFLARATGAAEMRNGKVVRVYGTLEDVTKRREREQEALNRERQLREAAEAAYTAESLALQKQAWTARHDSLTGIGNRKYLDETLGNLQSQHLMVIMIDLDRFKHINDSFGHEAGDHVLVQTADRLRRAGTSSDLIFRIGGDEFAMLVDLKRLEQSPQAYCDWLLDSLIETTSFKGISLHFGASIGYSTTDGTISAKDAIRRADMALFEAKTQGRNRALAYAAPIGAAYLEKIELANNLQFAIGRGEFEVALQPQVSATSGELTGCEALGRWHHPTKGTIAPNVFVPLAEELNLIAEIDKAVLNAALKAKSELMDRGLELPKISVNVSARRLAASDLLDEISNRRDIPHGSLAFEILETAFLDSVEDELIEKLETLRRRGVLIEVDDFGTGHASFASVLALKPDVLKFDRLFATGIDLDPKKQELVQGLIKIANNVGAKTLIEGVETPEQMALFGDIGVDYLQGFAVAEPMNVDQFHTWARNRTSGCAA